MQHHQRRAGTRLSIEDVSAAYTDGTAG
ncbi:hypothetical protein CBM2631_B120353 [Cupriavidus taiwanensis]|nr:hypothetical protein CBM2621_B140035 [Cupriavidus taiwanensis]SPA19674.1 hypothetical protein CBM2631_B120353 [Cupriavidus taiwanensis]